MALEVPTDFGNYALKGIEEIHFPEPVAWWPETTDRALPRPAGPLFQSRGPCPCRAGPRTEWAKRCPTVRSERYERLNDRSPQ